METHWQHPGANTLGKGFVRPRLAHRESSIPAGSCSRLGLSHVREQLGLAVPQFPRRTNAELRTTLATSGKHLVATGQELGGHGCGY